ncbi:hypothetical protein DYP60_12475 [Sphaerochaeta halotolerans]|uniref:Uncharacterized protein n=1 Tax=Sphaerochaeta halotolerans TaxID=2293840 RepID=A0A372MEJ3_9SPIR|nr:hypothetical protein [Sphaerochaeta halotolerans]RFU93873.1 hypothetical protein DYP60_12475 [Sphaerochaeta halotolerans]
MGVAPWVTMVLNPAYKKFMKYFSTERLYLKTVAISELKGLQAFLLKNRTFLSPWEPLRDDAYYSEEAILQRIEQEILLDSQEKQLSLHLTRTLALRY